MTPYHVMLLVDALSQFVLFEVTEPLVMFCLGLCRLGRDVPADTRVAAEPDIFPVRVGGRNTLNCVGAWPRIGDFVARVFQVNGAKVFGGIVSSVHGQ